MSFWNTTYNVVAFFLFICWHFKTTLADHPLLCHFGPSSGPSLFVLFCRDNESCALSSDLTHRPKPSPHNQASFRKPHYRAASRHQRPVMPKYVWQSHTMVFPSAATTPGHRTTEDVNLVKPTQDVNFFLWVLIVLTCALWLLCIAGLLRWATCESSWIHWPERHWCSVKMHLFVSHWQKLCFAALWMASHACEWSTNVRGWRKARVCLGGFAWLSEMEETDKIQYRDAEERTSWSQVTYTC